VYDVTSYLEDHPGGPDIVTDVAGLDATDDYMDIGHSEDADAMLVDYLIGTVEGADSDDEDGSDKKSKQRPVTVSNPADSRRTVVGASAGQSAKKQRNDGPDYVMIAAGVLAGVLAVTFIRRRLL
jgi:cytochrome-b5 reductase